MEHIQAVLGWATPEVSIVASARADRTCWGLGADTKHGHSCSVPLQGYSAGQYLCHHELWTALGEAGSGDTMEHC